MGETMQAEARACAELEIPELTGKWLAMFRYNREFATFEETEAAFRQHPEWRDA